MATTVTASLPPLFDAQFFGVAGAPAAGYKLYTYATGTTTAKTTYADQAAGAANPNPITLDADGRCALWLDSSGEYALELRTPAGALVRRWDDVGAVPTPQSGSYVPLAGGVTMTGRYNLAGAAQSALQPVTLQQMQAAVAAIDGVTDSEQTAALAALLPAGVIVMWQGASTAIPAGWRLCDGSNGTPDLRNRFVIGAGSTYSPGATGGSAASTTDSQGAHTHTLPAATDSHVLTVAEMPAHKHVTYYGENASYPNGVAATGKQGSNATDNDNAWPYSSTEGGDAGHTHGLTGPTGSSGSHTHSVATVPPYYALCFIMKV